MFGGVFHDHLEGPWDQAKGFIREELEQMRAAIDAQWAEVFGTDNTLTVDAIANSNAPVPSYVANTGPNKKPRWDKVNVATGVINRLRFVNLKAATAASVLLGRGSANGPGDFEEITPGTNLTMVGTTLNATFDPSGAIPDILLLRGQSKGVSSTTTVTSSSDINPFLLMGA